jgi:O-antigen/teichoic acid export membrane protein
MNKVLNTNISARSKSVIANISLSFISKIVSIAISFLLVNITIKYLGSEQYGIWMTLLSIISWATFFDIGLGNGLRNKLTEAISVNNIKDAREYISTAYASLTGIIVVILVAVTIIIPNINWNKVFNSEVINNSKFINLISIVLCFFLINFVLSLYNQLFYAFQQAALTGIGQLLFNLITLTNIIVLNKIREKNIIYLGVSYGLAMVVSSALLTLYFFTKNKEFLPRLRYIKVSKIKSILGIGIKFFIIGIAGIVIFTTDNIVITQVLGPEHVTVYSTILKLFNTIIMGHTIVVTPLWSAYTQAYINGDIKWIKRTLGKLNLLMLPITLCVIIFIWISERFLRAWIGENIIIPKYLITFMAIYAIIAVWNNIYAYFLNGINALNVQMYSSIFGAIINIPLSVLFSGYFGLGSSGVILGTIISLSIFSILGPIQAFQLIKLKENESTCFLI